MRAGVGPLLDRLELPNAEDSTAEGDSAKRQELSKKIEARRHIGEARWDP